MNKRTILIKAQVGSHNYNLNDSGSDRDYKVVIAPNFNDLYESTMFSKDRIGKTFDISVHDVRKMPNVWKKANINFLEILFSKEIIINPVLDKKTRGLLLEILSMRNEIAMMNIPYLYNSCVGMFENKMSKLTKGTEGTAHLVEQYGYDTKQAQHAYRVLDFLERYKDTDFRDFGKAIWYDNNDPSREILVAIKKGEYSIGEFINIARKKQEYINTKVAPEYKCRSANGDTLKKLTGIIKEIVRFNI